MTKETSQDESVVSLIVEKINNWPTENFNGSWWIENTEDLAREIVGMVRAHDRQ